MCLHCGPAGSRVVALTESGSSEGLPLFVCVQLCVSPNWHEAGLVANLDRVSQKQLLSQVPSLPIEFKTTIGMTNDGFGKLSPGKGANPGFSQNSCVPKVLIQECVFRFPLCAV